MPSTNVWLHSALTYRIIIPVHLYGVLYVVSSVPHSSGLFRDVGVPTLLLTLKPAHSQSVCVARKFERPKHRLGPPSSPEFPGLSCTVHLMSRCRGPCPGDQGQLVATRLSKQSDWSNSGFAAQPSGFFAASGPREASQSRAHLRHAVSRLRVPPPAVSG